MVRGEYLARRASILRRFAKGGDESEGIVPLRQRNIRSLCNLLSFGVQFGEDRLGRFACHHYY
jgi:hypothetical protein